MAAKMTLTVMVYILHNNEKWIPVFYFEDLPQNIPLKIIEVRGWDIALLKFCCKVQGIGKYICTSNSCPVINVDDVKKYSPLETSLKIYWPKAVPHSKVVINRMIQEHRIIWTVPTPLIPPVATNSPSLQDPSTQAEHLDNQENLLGPPMQVQNQKVHS